MVNTRQIADLLHRLSAGLSLRRGPVPVLLALVLALVAGCSRCGSVDVTSQETTAPSTGGPPASAGLLEPSPTGTPQLPPYLPIPGLSPGPGEGRPTPVITEGRARGTIPLPPEIVRRVPAPPTEVARPEAGTGTSVPADVVRRRTPTPVPPQATARPERRASTGEPDPRYAVTLHTAEPEAQEWFLENLGTEWFIDGTYDSVDRVPSGHDKVIYIGSLPGPSTSQIWDMAAKYRGAVWMAVNEPNRRPDYDADLIVEDLHDIYRTIKTADPTAKLMSPTILNWEFTCTLCIGYQTGHSWLREFRAEYLAAYGEEPPIDIWAVNAYPLDWFNLPTVNPGIPIRQISGLRKFLDGIPAQRDKPIWVTELSLHWGWDRIYIGRDGCGDAPSPGGTYHTVAVIEYLGELYDWLESNADRLNIERWFQYVSYRDIAHCSLDGYAGLTLFDGPEPGAKLTPVGRYFKRRSMGIR